MSDLDLLVARAEKTVRDGGFGRFLLWDHLRIAEYILACSIRDEDWDRAAEVLVMLREITGRFDYSQLHGLDIYRQYPDLRRGCFPENYS